MSEDGQLIRRMKSGDDTAIEEFVRKYYPQILRYCRLHSPDLDTAEDMTQETFLRFFRSLPGYQHYGKAANYLYVIAGNCCRDDWRRARPLSLEEVPESFTEDMEEIAQVRLALSRLPEELQEAATLFFIQERRQADIAKILGISLPLVKYRIGKAKKLLKSLLGEEETP